MSTVLRQAYLRLCKGLGKKRITSKSGIGHPFVCHLGDFLGENPFYNREAFRTELEVCASWLRTENKPIVFDVGANVGFWSTHLAQMIDTQSPEIYAFEPVPSTFCKLRESVEDLSLESSVFPIAVAITDRPRSLRLSYSPQDSLFAQIADHGLNTRVGDQMVHAVGTTLDEFSASLGIVPSFIKVDVEGSETAVLRGARGLLSDENRPALMIEFNPVTLSETGATILELQELLHGYHLFYVDDFEGQKRPIGDSIEAISELSWVCNLLAIPTRPGLEARYSAAIAKARTRCR